MLPVRAEAALEGVPPADGGLFGKCLAKVAANGVVMQVGARKGIIVEGMVKPHRENCENDG